MAEGFNEWGDYGAEEEWQSRSTIRKIFSFRSFKQALKLLGALFVITIVAILGYRLSTGLSVPNNTKKLVWTDNLIAAYEKNNNLAVYVQTPEENYEEDGAFSIHSFKFIPEINQVQLTIKYNVSTNKFLAGEFPDDEIDDFPFVFALRDNTGKIYNDFKYTYYKKGLYTYARLVYDNVDLFSSSIVPVTKEYFTPDASLSQYIYKGSYAPSTKDNKVTMLFLDSYYENDIHYGSLSWAHALTVYKSSLPLEKYNISKDAPSKASINEFIAQK